MRKLTLNPEDLCVDSFETDKNASDGGTVLANEGDPHTGRCTLPTVQCGTCYESCDFTACPMDCETLNPCGPIYVTDDHC